MNLLQLSLWLLLWVHVQGKSVSRWNVNLNWKVLKLKCLAGREPSRSAKCHRSYDISGTKGSILSMKFHWKLKGNLNISGHHFGGEDSSYGGTSCSCKVKGLKHFKQIKFKIYLWFQRRQVAALEEKMRRFDTLEENRLKNKSVLRSCDEIHAFDPSKASGHYRIDPDGALIGDDPFRVHCNMSTGEFA